MHYDVVIVGAGPGGLACATKLSQNGASTLVIERKPQIGPKVCAGGITWSGLLKTVPEQLIEKAFPCQHVWSRLQNICVSSETPIIATVDRKNLGRYMADAAKAAGVKIHTSTSLRHITDSGADLFHHPSGERSIVSFDYMIGADGSTSSVRRHLGIPTNKVGIGINYQLPCTGSKMEWHLNNRYFGNGYGWIFPHKESTSIGAYAPAGIAALQLKKRLCHWSLGRGYDLSQHPCKAGYINYDYRGHHFDRTFLIGDAGGFASALTGEGIYPAIITGESVALKIIDPNSDLSDLDEVIRRQRKFAGMVSLTSKSGILSAILAEVGVFALRNNMINFTMLEMGK